MFYCTQCYRSSFSALTSPCLHCGYFDPKSTVSGNFNPTEPEAPSQYGTASGSKRNLLPNSMQMDELARTLDRTRNVSKRRIELDNNSTNKRSRHDICAVTIQALPTRNEQVAMDYDMAKETRPASQIAFNKSPLDGIQNKFPNSKESHLHYEDMQEFGNLENSIQQNSASNFDSFQITQNLNLQKEISYIVAPVREMIPYVEDHFAVPGPSGSHENKNTSNLWVKELQSVSAIELSSAGELRCMICEEVIWKKEDHGNVETCGFCNMKFLCKTLLLKHSLDNERHYASNCRVCPKTISEHVDPEDKTFNKCCQCSFRNRLRYHLRNHLYTHTDLKLYKCDLCDKRFAQKSGLCNHLYTHS